MMQITKFKLLVRSWLLFSVLAVQTQLVGAVELSKDQPKGPVILTVSGKLDVKNTADAAVFDAAMLDALPQKSYVVVIPWYKEPVKFTGPLLKDVLQALKAKGTSLKAIALNDYVSSIPFDDAFKYDVILARQMDGRVLSVRDKGPIFVMYPFENFTELKNATYYGRCVWQLKALIVE